MMAKISRKCCWVSSWQPASPESSLPFAHHFYEFCEKVLKATHLSSERQVPRVSITAKWQNSWQSCVQLLEASLLQGLLLGIKMEQGSKHRHGCHMHNVKGSPPTLIFWLKMEKDDSEAQQRRRKAHESLKPEFLEVKIRFCFDSH